MLDFDKLFPVAVGLTIVGSCLWLWALISCLTVRQEHDFRTGTKLIWVLVILLGHGLGAVLYLLLGRPDRSASRDLGQAR